MPALLRRLDNDISRFVLTDDLIDEPIGDFDVLGRIDLQTAQQIVLGDLLVDLDAWIDLDGTPEVLDGLDVVVLVGRRLEFVDRIVDVVATVTVLLERRPVSLTLGLFDGVSPVGSSVRSVFGRVVNVRIVTHRTLFGIWFEGIATDILSPCGGWCQSVIPGGTAVDSGKQPVGPVRLIQYCSRRNI